MKRFVSVGVVTALILITLARNLPSGESAAISRWTMIKDQLRSSLSYRKGAPMGSNGLSTISYDNQRRLGLNSNHRNFNLISVPDDGLTLQEAIDQVPGGGIIELANGTYNSPSGGFVISNMNKGFTIRAAQGANVILDGGGSREVLRFMNTDRNQGGPVVFEGLTFANGYSTSDGLAGGVTMQYAEATFVDCSFLNNVGQQPITGGGAVVVTLQSDAFFVNCTWSGNSGKNFGGGLQVHSQSDVFIHTSQFSNNRTNLPNHLGTAAGGAIHVGNASLWVANSRFEDNQAGYVGGAIYVIGEWNGPPSVPVSDVVVVNSTFINNRAVRDPSVSPVGPTEAGAIHVENQARMRIYSSRFITNKAEIGGGVSTYRGTVEIEHSLFQGNQATGTGNGNGFGGAIAAVSNDSVSDGSINRPNANLTIRDTLIQGWYSSVEIVGQAGGGIYVTGDVSRMYGENGVSQMGTASDNRAVAIVEDVILTNLDVEDGVAAPGTGLGGGVVVTLTDLTLDDSIIILSDAIGSNGSAGGGMAILNQSVATVSDTSLARNTAEVFGAALFVQGSDITFSNLNIIENELSPGVSESIGTSYGAAIFTTPDDGRGLPVTGTVESSVISNNIGLSIYDDDREPGPINDVRYNDNDIYSTTFDSSVYSNSLPFQCCKSVAELNALVISRSGGPSTDKSQFDNTAPGSSPIVGNIRSAPSELLSTGAAGDPSPPVTFLGYAWTGGIATLNGDPVVGNADWGIAPGIGSHTLEVSGSPFITNVVNAQVPSGTFSGAANGTGDWTLSWSLDAGTYLGMGIDQGVSEIPAVSGTVDISEDNSIPIRAYFIAEEGGLVVPIHPTRLYLPLTIR